MPDATVAVDVGRRERKKQAVRDALVDAALDLFARQGVDATTVDQISAIVDVSPRTFHRHFPTKLDVMFAEGAELSARFEVALAERPADEPLLVSLREALCELTDTLSTRREREVRRARVIESHEGLQAINVGRSEAWAASIARLSAARLGVRADDILPQLLGTCAVGAVRTARGRWLNGRARDLTAEFRHAFETMTALGQAIEERSR